MRALEWETEGIEEVAVVWKGVDDGTGGGSQNGAGERDLRSLLSFFSCLFASVNL